MKKKYGFSMLLLSVMLAVSLIFVAIPDVATGGAGSPEPTDVKFKSGNIAGFLTAELGGEQVPIGSFVTLTLVGICGEKFVDSYVEVGPIEIGPIPMDRPNFSKTGWRDLIELYIEVENAGPAGCFSETGGETLMIKDVKKVYEVVEGGDLGVFVADVVVKARK